MTEKQLTIVAWSYHFLLPNNLGWIDCDMQHVRHWKSSVGDGAEATTLIVTRYVLREVVLVDKRAGGLNCALDVSQPHRIVIV
jgi:hypothetical protein